MGIVLLSAVFAGTVLGEPLEVATPEALTNALSDASVTEIKLTAASYDLSSVAMDFDTTLCCLRAKNNVKVYGRTSNPRDTVLFGDGTRRIVYSDASKFYNVTISNGYANAGYAGGFWSPNSASVLSNCVVTCNLGDGIDCGGVAWATCYDCEICYNNSGHGAGAAHNTIWGGSLHHNVSGKSGGGGLHVTAHRVKVYANKAARGGGLSSNSACTVEGCEIFDNESTVDEGGGAMCITPSAENSYVFTNCVFYGNKATTFGGGAARCRLIDCIVTNNTAVSGGGIATASAFDSLVADNYASSPNEGGGGAYNSFLDHSVVSNNVAAWCGGGLYKGAATNTTIISNVATNYGGGLSNANVTNCIIVANEAISGGGSYYSRIYRSLIAGNRALSEATGDAARGGGGSFTDQRIDTCVVSNNTAYYRGGGTDLSTVVDSRIVMNCVRSKDGSAEVRGGGAYGGKLTGTVIAGNAASRTSGNSFGGGVWDAELVGCTLFNNFGKVGSAMHSGTATDCVFSNNVSTGSGYTIRCSRSLVNCYLDVQQLEAPGRMLHCTVTGGGRSVTIPEGANVSTSGTFATSSTLIVNTQSPRMAATNCLFYGNNVALLIQGPYNADNQVLHLSNCTFASNRCDATVAAVPGTSGKNGSIVIENCIFSGNLTRDGAVARDFKPELPEQDTQVYMSNCLITEPPVSTWAPLLYSAVQTRVSPRFVGKGDHPYQLRTSSPARNAGLVYGWMSNATDIRGAGYPRLSADNRVDLGCYQCWLNPAGFILMAR